MARFQEVNDPDEFWVECRDKEFNDTKLVIDCHKYINCIIKNCTLIYAGGPSHLESTSLYKCKFRYTGFAAQTLQFYNRTSPEVSGIDGKGNIKI